MVWRIRIGVHAAWVICEDAPSEPQIWTPRNRLGFHRNASPGFSDRKHKINRGEAKFKGGLNRSLQFARFSTGIRPENGSEEPFNVADCARNVEIQSRTKCGVE